MSDFDERLTAVLAAEADDAPHSAGLAQVARHRHVLRRRRRIAAGGVAAALVIAAPVAVLAGADDGDDNKVGNDQTSASGEWQTVGQDDVRAEIPGDWGKFTCDFDGFTREIYGPTEEDACGFGTYLAFYVSATFDPFEGPGVVAEGPGDGPRMFDGYVYAGDLAVSSSTPDRDLTRRVLASARVDGQPEVDATEWQTVEGVGLRGDLPTDWGLGPDQETSFYGVCAVPGERDERPDTTDRTEGAEDAYIALDFRDGRWISVSAPTPAVGDLVMASVESAPGSTGIGCLPVGRWTDGSPTSDPANDTPCDPGFGDPKPRAGCPDPEPTLGTVVLQSSGEVALEPNFGPPNALDLDAIDVCTGAIRVDYREPLADHVVECDDFRDVLESGGPPIPVAVWQEGEAIVQMSELYQP